LTATTSDPPEWATVYFAFEARFGEVIQRAYT